MSPNSLLKAAARSLTQSPFFSPAQRLWDRNKSDFVMPLTRLQKAYVGTFVVLSDWGQGIYPPRFERDSTWENEIHYVNTLPGVNSETWYKEICRAPFGYDESFKHYLKNLLRIWKMLRACSLSPPATVLELGCAHGWLSEILALMGFSVIGTSISPEDIQVARKRVEALAIKLPGASLAYECLPMEEISKRFQDIDCIVVHEALHHAYDWKKTIESAALCLNRGGWFLICNEPNLAHTFISYRVAKLSNTHEIGISRRALKKQLHSSGFSRIRDFASPFHFGVGWHWIAAQK